VLSAVCLSVLQAGIIFQAINWLLYFYIPNKRDPSWQ